MSAIASSIESNGLVVLGQLLGQRGSTPASRCKVRYDGSRRPERSSEIADSVSPAFSATWAAVSPASSIDSFKTSANRLTPSG